MQHILQKFGFAPSLEYMPDQYKDKVEVWYRPVDSDVSGMISGISPTAGIS
jgi:hypothetical protein